MRIIVFLAAFLALPGSVQAAQIVGVDYPAAPPARWEMFEIRVALADIYDNPYDPDEVRVDAEIRDPDGQVRVVPAFWFEPYERSLDGDHEIWTAAGDGEWRVRYAPRSEGTYMFTIAATDAAGEDRSAEYGFGAGPATGPGFVRVDPNNRRYFTFDDGTSYVPLGFNVDWVREPGGSFVYDQYLDSIAGGGGNWTRLWMTHFADGTALEWGAYHPSGYYQGLGRYSQPVAAKLDEIFSHARDAGVEIQLVFHQHSQFECAAWSSWADNPYNAADGGPCATSVDYFTNPVSLALADKLHRYIVARYSAFRSILAWELWNEADLILGVGQDLMGPWARDAAARVREMDPAGHLVTTSYGSPVAFPSYDLSTWDYNNRHVYAYGSWIFGLILDPYREAGSPVMVSEFGLDWQGQLHLQDTIGVNVHNGIWSALMHGYAGGSMYWWWDDYIGPDGMWDLNRPAAEFMRGEDIRLFTQDLDARASWAGTPLEVCGLLAPNANPMRAWVWAHDMRSDWWGPMEALPFVEGAEIVISLPDDLTPVSFTGEVWDAWTGENLYAVSSDAAADQVRVSLQPFERDVALKLVLTPSMADDDTLADDTSDDDTLADDAADDDAFDDVMDDDEDDTQVATMENGGENDDDNGACCG